jgi:serine O-acetyltransferase
MKTSGSLREIIAADLYRYWGDVSRARFWQAVRHVPGFRYTFFMRCCAEYKRRGARIRFVVCRLLLRRYQFKYGFDIPYSTSIGAGLYIGHFGGVVINAEAKLGSNVNLSHGVTIGQMNRGSRAGVPEIGDRVWIGPNAVIVGRIKIGNEVLIAPGAYVYFDVPDRSIVVGNPGKIVSDKGVEGYVNNTI